MGTNLRLDSIKSFEDVRAALQKVKEAIDGSVLEKGEWAFFEITLAKAVSHLKYPHNLNFTPKDVIQLSVTNSVSVTWEYGSFDGTNLSISSSGACVVRAYVGAHREGAI